MSSIDSIRAMLPQTSGVLKDGLEKAGKGLVRVANVGEGFVLATAKTVAAIATKVEEFVFENKEAAVYTGSLFFGVAAECDLMGSLTVVVVGLASGKVVSQLESDCIEDAENEALAELRVLHPASIAEDGSIVELDDLEFTLEHQSEFDSLVDSKRSAYSDDLSALAKTNVFVATLLKGALPLLGYGVPLFAGLVPAATLSSTIISVVLSSTLAARTANYFRNSFN